VTAGEDGQTYGRAGLAPMGHEEDEKNERKKKRKCEQAKTLKNVQSCENAIPQELNKMKREMNSRCLRGIRSRDEGEV
jgi:hypothetical protein